MTIKTLEAIHKALQEEYIKKDRTYQLARKNACEAEEDGAENAEATSMEELREINAVIRRVRAALRQTESALDDLAGVIEGGDTE